MTETEQEAILRAECGWNVRHLPDDDLPHAPEADPLASPMARRTGAVLISENHRR